MDIGDVLDLIECIIGFVFLVSIIWSAIAANGWKGFLAVIGIISGLVFLTFGIENLFNYIFKNNNLTLFIGLFAMMAIFLIGVFVWGVFQQYKNLDKNGKKDYIKKLLKEIAILVGIMVGVSLILYFIFTSALTN